jgi:beta-galactosidase GanA
VEFIKAGSPKDAIDMYIHQEDWLNAQRVAESFDPASTYDVLEAQARVAMERKDYELAERKFEEAKKPEEAIRMYTELGRHADAERIKKAYKMDVLPEEQNLLTSMTETQSLVGSKQYSAAIDEELKKNVNNTDDEVCGYLIYCLMFPCRMS